MEENSDLNKYRKGYLWNHKRATRRLSTMHTIKVIIINNHNKHKGDPELAFKPWIHEDERKF